MSYTPGPLPKPRGWIIDGQADGIGFRETAPEGILALVVSSAPVYTDHQLVAHTAAEVARAVAAERERWTELVQSLVACHEEPSCPAVEWARDVIRDGWSSAPAEEPTKD